MAMTGHEIHWLSWTGSALLSVCGVPQAVKAKRSPRSTVGLSWWFLWLWLSGEMLTGIGLFGAVSWPVRMNYVLNSLLVAYVMMVKSGQ